MRYRYLTGLVITVCTMIAVVMLRLPANAGRQDALEPDRALTQAGADYLLDRIARQGDHWSKNAIPLEAAQNEGASEEHDAIEFSRRFQGEETVAPHIFLAMPGEGEATGNQALLTILNGDREAVELFDERVSRINRQLAQLQDRIADSFKETGELSPELQEAILRLGVLDGEEIPRRRPIDTSDSEIEEGVAGVLTTLINQLAELPTE